MNSEFANDVAEKLYADGREMQLNLENSILALRSQSELAECSNLNLQVIGQENSLELRTANDELMNLRTALEYSRRQATMHADNVQQLVKESLTKVHEANQARLESIHRLRNAEFEIVRRTDMSRNAENGAIARLRMESLMSSNNEMQLEHYETLYNDEKLENAELRSHLSDQDSRLRTVMAEGLSASSGAHMSTGTLENQVKIAEIRAQDMSTEMNELVVANNQLKTQLAVPRPSGSQGMDETRINNHRDELTSERNSKLKTWADYETKMWKYASDLREKDNRIKDEKAMLGELRGELVDAQNELKRKSSPANLRAQVLLESMSFSAGIPPLDVVSQHREEVLTDEVQQWKDEIGIYKAWIRQMDARNGLRTAVGASLGQAAIWCTADWFWWKVQ